MRRSATVATIALRLLYNALTATAHVLKIPNRCSVSFLRDEATIEFSFNKLNSSDCAELSTFQNFRDNVREPFPPLKEHTTNRFWPDTLRHVSHVRGVTSVTIQGIVKWRVLMGYAFRSSWSEMARKHPNSISYAFAKLNIPKVTLAKTNNYNETAYSKFPMHLGTCVNGDLIFALFHLNHNMTVQQFRTELFENKVRPGALYTYVGRNATDLEPEYWDTILSVIPYVALGRVGDIFEFELNSEAAFRGLTDEFRTETAERLRRLSCAQPHELHTSHYFRGVDEESQLRTEWEVDEAESLVNYR